MSLGFIELQLTLEQIISVYSLENGQVDSTINGKL